MRVGHLLVISAFLGWIFWPGYGGKPVEFNVSEGQNAHEVADILRESKLIRAKLPFIFWTKVRRAAPRIQIGRYRIPKGRSSFWIVDDLIHGRADKVKLVIPEGFASWQIAERLDEFHICEGAAFKAIVQKEQLEGYLFPATYELINGLAPATVAARLKEQFELRWTPEFEARAKAIGFTKHQTVTLASIIEREVRVRDELPLVSAVYHNRLRKRMRLEADPTVQFSLGYWKSRLTYDDYHNTKSPYNTYMNFGLPPGPICNPGWDAVRAALWPATSNALFFLAAEDGRHTFSDNYRDHTNKVNRRNRLMKKK